MGSKIGGIIVLAVALAGLGDLLAHSGGTKTLFSGTNSLLGTTFKGASGAYA